MLLDAVKQIMMYHSMHCLCGECKMLDGAFIEGEIRFGKETELRIFTESGDGSVIMATFLPRDGEWIRVEEESVSPEEERMVVEESKTRS